MGSPIHSETERRIRQLRLTAAFIDAAIASTATLHALLAAIYRTSPEPLAHAHRVALVSVRVGEELGLVEQELEHMERAAWVHDLGKLVMPDRARREPDVVEPEDLRRWGDQVQIAADIAGSAVFLRPAADLVLASRECFDGTGFPRGLRGESIPIGSRILHVADTFDALTSLCLALAVSSEAVNVELVRHAGSRFDPDVVAAWLRCSEGPTAAVIPGAGVAERQL